MKRLLTFLLATFLLLTFVGCNQQPATSAETQDTQVQPQEPDDGKTPMFMETKREEYTPDNGWTTLQTKVYDEYGNIIDHLTYGHRYLNKYDENHNLIEQVHHDTDGTVTTYTYTYTFDDQGKILDMETYKNGVLDPLAPTRAQSTFLDSVKREYDDQGKLTREALEIDGIQCVFVYQYDNDRLTSASHLADGKETCLIRFSYDEQGRVTEVRTEKGIHLREAHVYEGDSLIVTKYEMVDGSEQATERYTYALTRIFQDPLIVSHRRDKNGQRLIMWGQFPVWE